MTSWDNRFARPDPSALVAQINEAHRAPFTTLQARLDAVEGASRDLRWLGIPWRWTFVYSAESEDLAFLVPDPARPLLALPLPVSTLDAAALKNLSRPVRDGLSRARVVADTAWAEWELTSATLATDLARFLARQPRPAANA